MTRDAAMPEPLRVYPRGEFEAQFAASLPLDGDLAIMAHTPRFLGKAIERRGEDAEGNIRLLLTGPLDLLRDGRQRYMEPLGDQKKQLGDRLEIRQAVDLPSVGLVITDDWLTVAVYTPDPRSKAANKSVFMVRRPADSDAKTKADPGPDHVHSNPYDFYRADFERLWAEAEPFDPAQDLQRYLLRNARLRYQAALRIPEPTEVAFVIALAEEFEYFLEAFAPDERPFFEQDPLTGQYTGHFSLMGPDRPMRCVAVLVGAMGHTGPAQLVERLVAMFDVHTVVSLGIAGATHEDVRIGDVVVASQVNSYFENAKARDGKNKQFAFTLGGQSFRSTHALWQHALHLRFAEPAGEGSWETWRSECKKHWQEVEAEVGQDAIESFDRVLPKAGVRLHANDAHIASGPILGASAHFVRWLRDHGDRKILALEMETGGAMAAAGWRAQPVQTLAVRGISDIAYSLSAEAAKQPDGKGSEPIDKKAIERTFGAHLRRYAMLNATHLVRVLIRRGCLSRP